MPHPPARSPAAGGALIALGALGGAVVGFAFHQPTIGFFIGVAAGIAASVVIWLVGSRR